MAQSTIQNEVKPQQEEVKRTNTLEQEPKTPKGIAVPRDVLELLEELEYHWTKARELIPKIYELGIQRGMKALHIRKLINSRVDLSSRQIRNLTPEKYRDLSKRNGNAGKHQKVKVDYKELVEKMLTTLNSKISNTRKVRLIVKMVKENKLV